MENCGDFVQLLDPDVSTNILSCLDDPADIVRVSCVSRSWHQFVIENGFSKRLCLKLFPEVSSAANDIEVDDMIEPVKVGSNDSKVLENSEKNHRVYTILARGLSPTLKIDCISEAIYATSTDNDPEENISNTLEPRDRIEQRGSYWSSEGESDDRVPERLTYRLCSKLCVITEINIQPFQAYFQYGFPIYSAKAVRFRMGHRKSPLETRTNTDEDRVDGYYVWTYVSPEFPMIQENCLQKFKLPKPVLCVGGFLQVELLGRVQKQEMDGLFYICVSHVQVVGRPLLPTFDAEVLNHSGKCVVKYCPEGESTSSTRPCEDSGESSRLNTLTARLMRRAGGWEQVILNTLLGNAVVDTNIDTDTDIDSDEEMVL